MQISIIAAMTKDRVIGQGNKMPWHIPEELQHFKAMTMGKPMIMGRATFDSIGKRILPGRTTIIITRKPNYMEQGIIVVNSIEQALEQALLAAGDVGEVMVVGGANIYKQFLPLANTMYLSIIHQVYTGDVLFPEYNQSQWKVVLEQRHTAFTVQTLEKIT
jgi:dihydrofolate reductase